MSVRRDADLITGRIDAIVPGGAGIVRDRDGVVLAKGGLPGELVEIAIERVQKRVRHGRVLQVIEPSPDRIAADCAWHPKCGGCDLLELDPNAALRVRTEIVRDALVRIAKIERDVVERVLQPIAHAPLGSSDALRRRVRVVVGDGGAATFSESESHERVAIAHCAAVVPALDAALALLPQASLPVGVEVRLAVDDRGHISAALERKDAQWCARLVEAGIAKGAVAIDVVDESEIARVGDVELVGEVTANAFACVSDAAVFTQATRFGGAKIRELVVEMCGAPQGYTRLLELFAGSGHLSIPLSASGFHVHAYEGSKRAVSFLQRNASHAHPRHVFGVATYIDAKTKFIDDNYDIVVVDPPRTGVVGFDSILVRTRPKKVVMVSCDVATGARDLAIAMKRGYEIERITPIDAFPRTSHVEWVASLRASS